MGASLGRLLHWGPGGSPAGTGEAGPWGTGSYGGSRCGRAQASSNPQGHSGQGQSRQPQGGAQTAESSGLQTISWAL